MAGRLGIKEQQVAREGGLSSYGVTKEHARFTAPRVAYAKTDKRLAAWLAKNVLRGD